MQTALESAQRDAASAQSTLSDMRKSHDSLQARLTESMTRVSDLSSQIAASEASFKAEIETQKRLVDLLERRDQEGRRRLEEVEREWEERRTELEEGETRWAEDLERERARGDELERRVEEMRSFAERVTAGGAVAGGEESPLGGLPPFTLSPSATLASKLQKSGRSYTEVYVDYVRVQDELAKERAESKRLGECLAQILGDIEERVSDLVHILRCFLRSIGRLDRRP
jgi:nucleoprotein TPR